MGVNRCLPQLPTAHVTEEAYRVGSLWVCAKCGREIVTTCGGPAPMCAGNGPHGECAYRGGIRVVLPDSRWIGDKRVSAASK